MENKINWKYISEEYPRFFNSFLENAELSSWCAWNHKKFEFHNLTDYRPIPDAAIMGMMSLSFCNEGSFLMFLNEIEFALKEGKDDDKDAVQNT